MKSGSLEVFQVVIVCQDTPAAFPAFFTGCTMGQGGPQKLSTYQSWLEECGFTVTQAITKDAAEIPPDVIPVQAILSTTKTA
jgi:hypothetical protein